MADYLKAAGINKALFKVRIMKNILNRSKEEVYRFIISTHLQNYIEKEHK